MAKATVYKQAKAWVFENLSLTPNASPKKLFDILEATFPKEEVPTNAHAVATWVREFKANKEKTELSKTLSLFDPIDTFNDPEYRDLFSSDDKGWLIKYQSHLHTVYTQPMGLPSSFTVGVAIWVNKLKNAMPTLADRPLDLYLFGLAMLTLENRPDSEVEIAKAKNFLYAQPYISVDQFRQWVSFNTEDQRSMPVDVFKYVNLNNTKPDPKASDQDHFRWWIQLPELVAMNFALMPQHMPHIKMLNFVHWALNRFLFEQDNILFKVGDQDLLAEIESTMGRVGEYFEQIKIDKHIKENTLKLYKNIEDKYNTNLFIPEEFPSQMFDYYWAILVNTFSLAKSGGKLLGGLTIYPYSRMLKFQDLLPISDESKKKVTEDIQETVESKGDPLSEDTKGKL